LHFRRHFWQTALYSDESYDAEMIAAGSTSDWPAYFFGLDMGQRPHWLAGHVGFEPANPSASYLIGIP
jgi:hypothetical protein